MYLPVRSDNFGNITPINISEFTYKAEPVVVGLHNRGFLSVLYEENEVFQSGSYAGRRLVRADAQVYPRLKLISAATKWAPRCPCPACDKKTGAA